MLETHRRYESERTWLLSPVAGDPAEASKKIVREAFTKGAADNVTALVVEFPWVTAARVQQIWSADNEPAALIKTANMADPFDMFA